MTQSDTEINLSGETFELIPAAILTGILKNTTHFRQAKIQLDEHRQHAISKVQQFFQDQNVKMELQRVEKAQKASNPPGVIAEQQRKFREVMESIAKSDEEKREMLRNYKIPKICIDYYDVDFNELANIAIHTKQRRLAVTSTVQLTDEITVNDEVDVSEVPNHIFKQQKQTTGSPHVQTTSSNYVHTTSVSNIERAKAVKLGDVKMQILRLRDVNVVKLRKIMNPENQLAIFGDSILSGVCAQNVDNCFVSGTRPLNILPALYNIDLSEYHCIGFLIGSNGLTSFRNLARMKPISVYKDITRLVNYASDYTNVAVFGVLPGSDRYAMRENCQKLNQILCQRFKERYISPHGMLESDLSDDIHLSVEGARKFVIRVIPRFKNQAWNTIPFLPAKKFK